MTDLTEVTLESLAGGVAGELFQREWEQLLANVMDPNTSADAKRSVTLVVEVKPADSRDQMAVSIRSSVKLASVRPAIAQLFLGKKNGRIVAAGFDPRQTDAFRDSAGVEPIERARAAQGGQG